MRIKSILVALLLALTACSGQDDPVKGGPTPPPTTPTETTTPSTTPSDSPLQDGPVTPGRYRFVPTTTCDANTGCLSDKELALPAIDLTVPEGWDAITEFAALGPTAGRDTTSRNDPALFLGWTNVWVGLNSQPCSRVSHQTTDIPVGPTVGDFIDAVVAHPRLNVTEPKPVKLGKYRGQFFTLIGPKNISSDCEEWRPWDPGPYLQGEENRWDLWVMNINGVRLVIMAEYFPETPKDIKAELRAMAESIRFTPGKA
ncbi:MAG TPA: hypothetical protein VLI04_11380 [Nocardioidaceae bacterium]|nr:hypothetical protein [Nocardioidaceae bacterium]